MTGQGGTKFDGNIFSIPVSGGTPTTLFNFDGTHGEFPYGSLTLSPDGSTLYGMTAGGVPNYGTIFSIPVSGGTPTTLFNFDGTHGQTPYGSLTLSGSTLFGMTYSGGGIRLLGTILSIPVSGGTPTTLFNFDGTHGDFPYGSLTLGPDGSTLYGMTGSGGTNNDGTIFSIPVSGGTPTTLFNFDGTHGTYPTGGLTLSGSTLYGMTTAGGTNNDYGTIFSIPVSGGTPTTLFNFDGTHGYWPHGSLTLSGSTLYGMTGEGGRNSDGTIFSIPASGGTPTTLFNFDGTHGEDPHGSLTLSPDGSTLYGMTTLGGTNNDGIVFALTVPEPSTFILLAVAAISMLACVWRRRGAK